MKQILTIKSILTLKKGVALRFEHNFNNGTLILIDTADEKLWFGNTETLPLIKKLRFNKQKSIGEIFTELLSDYEECDYEKALSSLNDIINSLDENNLISVIKI